MAPAVVLILRQSSRAVAQSLAWAAASARTRSRATSSPPSNCNTSSTPPTPASTRTQAHKESLRRWPDLVALDPERGFGEPFREGNRGEERRGMRRPASQGTKLSGCQVAWDLTLYTGRHQVRRKPELPRTCRIDRCIHAVQQNSAPCSRKSGS